uniref:Uncharacterized protein n=1 Tax=Oryzias latipes TaxID=8090 RepID=A0A3P9I8A3_ORYLA
MKMCSTAFGVYGIEQRLDFLIFLWSSAEKKSSCVFMCVCVLLRTSQRDAGGCLGYLIQSWRAGFTPLTMHDRGICSDRHCVPPHSNWMKNVRRINIRSIFEKHSLNVLQTQKKCRFFPRSPSTLKVQIRLSSTFFSLRACVILGVVFILSSLCILGKAIHDLATKLLPEVDDFLFSVSIVSGLVCVILAVIKFMLGKVLTSRVLVTDGFNSLVGGVMGFSILISAEVFKHEPKVWYLDGTIGVLMGLIILAYGVKLLLDMIPRVRQTRNYERFE